MVRMMAVLMSLFGLAALAQAQGTPGASGERFGPQWRLLVGEWTSEPSPDGGAGNCAFRFELGDHILFRTNHAVLPASGNRPGGTHEDVMVIYPGATERQAQANYWDNEGHMIEYSASWSPDGNTLTFTSKPGPGPQFRLTYKKLEADSLSVSFDMASPGQPGAFKPYTSGRIRRQK